jgi:hypothetical protein
VLEEGFTGKDLDRHLPLALSFRRGMKVNMSMIFVVRPDSESCPRCHCHANNTSPRGMTIQWYVKTRLSPQHPIRQLKNKKSATEGCGMWFRFPSKAWPGRRTRNPLGTRAGHYTTTSKPSDFSRVQLHNWKIYIIHPSTPPPTTDIWGIDDGDWVRFVLRTHKPVHAGGGVITN